MELALSEAKARLSELVSAARRGERVVITQDGEPDVEIVRYRKRSGIDFNMLEATRRRLAGRSGGMEGGLRESGVQPSSAGSRR